MVADFGLLGAGTVALREIRYASRGGCRCSSALTRLTRAQEVSGRIRRNGALDSDGAVLQIDHRERPGLQSEKLYQSAVLLRQADMCFDQTQADLRFHSVAILAMQEASETFLVALFEMSASSFAATRCRADFFCLGETWIENQLGGHTCPADISS